MHEEQSSPNAIDERASQSQCPTDNGPNRAARRGCGLRRFHAPRRSSESFSRPTHTVCDLGPLPICGPSIRNYRFQGLLGPYPHDAPGGDADSDGELFGHLRRCCLGASQGEDRIRIRCCSSSVMAPNCNHDLNRSPDFSWALSSQQRWRTIEPKSSRPMKIRTRCARDTGDTRTNNGPTHQGRL